MSDSLQDQLLALGLARDSGKKKHQGSSRKPGKSRPNPGGEGGKKPGELSLQKAYARAEDLQRRLLNNEIRTLVLPHRLNRDDAEIARNFMFRGRIRKVHVTPEQLKALNAGELGIAYLSGGYHLLANEHVEVVRRLSAEHVADLATETEDDGDHPVPDDLN